MTAKNESQRSSFLVKQPEDSAKIGELSGAPRISSDSESQRGSLPPSQEYFSIAELAHRWRCSRGTVYNRLRALGAEVLDFTSRGKRGKKVIPAKTVLRIEERRTRRLS
jgi:hypothetical protein